MESKGFDFLLEKRLSELSPELSVRYRQCMSVFDLLLEKFHMVYPTFTDHSLLHCMNVLNYSNMIMEQNIEKLNADELYVYMVVVALHDVGMSIERRKFTDYIKKAGVEEYVTSHPDEPITSVSRRFHNDFSAVFIRENAELFDIPSALYAEAIARVARGHRKTDLADRTYYPVDFSVGTENRINLAFLGACIRIADEMDMANDRNSKLLYNIYNEEYTEKDILEFGKCESIKKVFCEGEKLVVISEPMNEKVRDGIFEYADGLREKLIYCRNVILSSGEYGFPWHEVEVREIKEG